MKKSIQSVVMSISVVLAMGYVAGVSANTEVDKGTPKLQQSVAKDSSSSAPRAQSTQPKKMARAKTKASDFDRLLAQYHRSGKPIPGQPAGQIKAQDPEPPKYEIADCGEGLVCCSYNGADSTCNLFMYLCTSQGGQATGDQNEAVCKF